MAKINVRQVITSYNEIAGLPTNFKDDYFAIKGELLQIISILNDGLLEPKFGGGSPEGVVTSNENRTYFDMSGANAIMYVNENIGVNTGWKQVNV